MRNVLRRLNLSKTTVLCAALLGFAPAATVAQGCGNSGAGFESWLAQYRTKAAAQGISARTLSSALDGVNYDPTVIRRDRGQRSFKQSFEEFYARRAGPGLIRRGQGLMRTHAGTLARVEQRFGVPPGVLVAIWGLETNFGADTAGKYSIIQSPRWRTIAAAPPFSRTS
jgi:membrane-bound lytic murein transglycosylase B